MDYEKKYKEALEKARQLCVYPTTKPFISDLQNLFPELAESEDERIRKELIVEVKEQIDWISAPDRRHEKDEKVLKKLNKWLTWLEKQGEQKPAWSEEDEEIHRKCICAMRASACGFPEEEKFVEQVDNWLKALKERYTWKPSDGQLECLGYAIEKAEKDWSPLTNNRIYLTLKTLKEQLEKL